MIIYKLTLHSNTPSNGKIYVGQTKITIKRRLIEYKNEIRQVLKGKKKTRPVISAMNKYGLDSFSWEMIEDNIIDGYTLNYREIFWIAELKATDRKIGYNVSLGGNCPTMGIKLEGERLKQAQENILRIGKQAAALRKGKPQTGVNLIASQENIKIARMQSIINRTGKKLTNEHSSNISKGLTNNPKVLAASKKPRPRTKLNIEQVNSIYNDNRNYEIIAKEYIISLTTILKIKKNKYITK